MDQRNIFSVHFDVFSYFVRMFETTYREIRPLRLSYFIYPSYHCVKSLLQLKTFGFEWYEIALGPDVIVISATVNGVTSGHNPEPC